MCRTYQPAHHEQIQLASGNIRRYPSRMPLTQHAPVAFVPTRNADLARDFYTKTLGLPLVSDDAFALVFRVGPAPGVMLRVIRVGDFTPAPFTAFGWETATIEQDIDDLTASGIPFLRYGHVEQDERGIWTAPGGTKIAWFNDPDGNTLSLTQH